MRVRVIEYRLQGSDAPDEKYLLITTLLEHEKHPASALAALYPQRWEIETAYDEFKTHLRGGSVVLRSKTPELVGQEFYACLLAHYSVRELMHQAALANDIDPDRLSFTHSIEVIKRKLPAFKAGFSPSEDAHAPTADSSSSTAVLGTLRASAPKLSFPATLLVVLKSFRLRPICRPSSRSPPFCQPLIK
jgi:hypothetical protein